MPSVSSAPDPRAAWHIAVTGSTGLIGSALVRLLETEGHRVTRIVHSHPDSARGDVPWNPATGELDAARLEGVDAVVHLAGENVGERWTEEKKERIRRSRVEGTRLLSEALAGLRAPPRVLVSASAVGLYGDRGEERLDETSPPGNDFLAEVAREWEAATRPAEERGVRVVHLRFGVVLSAAGGALAKMLPPFRLGVGGKLGSGEQWMSWVALDDVVGAIRFALFHEEVRGSFNVTSPHPVTNEEFTDALGDVLGRPTFATVPARVLRFLFGEMADSTLLASQRVYPKRLQQAGFHFRHPEIRGALRSALRET